MSSLKKILVIILKKISIGSALAIRLTKLTGKSKLPIHPKHFLTDQPWYLKYINKTDKILDLGCGNGQNSIKAAKIAKQVIGLEIDQTLLAIAKKSAQLKRLKNIVFKKGDLEKKLILKDNSFNGIIFLDVLEHLRNRDQILRELKRVLKPSGYLFLGVPSSETSWKNVQREAGICSFSDPDHKIEFSEPQIIRLLKKHQFEIINIGYSKYDTPLIGLIDIIGGFSLSLYKFINYYRQIKANQNPKEASGFEIVAKKLKE